jgi:hypothetical protein
MVPLSLYLSENFLRLIFQESPYKRRKSKEKPITASAGDCLAGEMSILRIILVTRRQHIHTTFACPFEGKQGLDNSLAMMNPETARSFAPHRTCLGIISNRIQMTCFIKQKILSKNSDANIDAS